MKHLFAITVFLLSPVALAKDFKLASGVYDGRARRRSGK